MASLAGRVALVTGASRGLGRAIAERLAREGAAVVAVDLKQPWAQGTIDLIETSGGTGMALAADVSDREAVHAAVATAVSTFGGLDILVNNAMWNSYDPIDAITPSTFDRMVGVGLAGIAWGIQAAAPAMRQRGGGSIINIGSMAGRLGIAGAMLYCGVKAGVDGMTRAASVELGADRIRVNAVAPSTVATEGVKAILSAESFASRVAQTPMRRLGETDDIANAVAWLASDQSSFITGQSIAVDGGIGHAFRS